MSWGRLALVGAAGLAAAALWATGAGSEGQAPPQAPQATTTHMGEVVVLTRGGATAAVTVWNPHSVPAGTALDVEVDVQADATGRFSLSGWELVLPDGSVRYPLGVPGSFAAGQLATAPVTFDVPLAATEGAAVRAAAGSSTATWRLG